MRWLPLAFVLAIVAPAAADPCTGISSGGGRFATCFDPGNRLSLTIGSDGYGGAIALRQEIHFDDEPDLVWRLEHVLVEATHAPIENRFTGTLYRAHFVRHARDGHIVIPFGVPRKVFLPFDIGAMAEVGRVEWTPDSLARVGIVKIAGLVDFARAHSFRSRFAIGPMADWSVDIEPSPRELGEHHVSPFTMALASLHLESSDGLLLGDLRLEGGMKWHSGGRAWASEASAEASIERIILAINDRPIAISLGARYATETGEAIARIGARIVLAQGRDPRVSLH